MIYRYLLFAVLTAFSTFSLAEKITAQSWLVADEHGDIIAAENIKEVRSIASITKIVSAMVVLDAQQELDQFIKPYTRKELIQLSMVRSDNAAADTLCRHYPGGYANCVYAMNVKAQALGLNNTRFVDATGLAQGNVSTAEELIKIVQAAADYPELVQASKMAEVKIQLKKRWLIFRNTNPIIGRKHEFVISKTGWIRASGGCIVMILDTDVGRRIVIVLGSKNTHTRIPEAEFIAQIRN